jgi:hypothetical protein
MEGVEGKTVMTVDKTAYKAVSLHWTHCVMQRWKLRQDSGGVCTQELVSETIVCSHLWLHKCQGWQGRRGTYQLPVPPQLPWSLTHP